MSKMGPLNRSGHAVSLFLADSGATFGIRSKTRPKPQCYRGCRAMQANTCFLCGIQVRRLAAGWGEMHVKNGSVEPVRPCCLPVFS